MTKNIPDIQNTLNNQTVFEAARVLLLGQVTEKKEKADPSHFLKFLLASRTNGTFGFALNASQPFAKSKEPLLSKINEL